MTNYRIHDMTKKQELDKPDKELICVLIIKLN